MRKQSTSWRDEIYYPVQQKTFEEALDLFLREEFPALGGPITRREIIKALKGIVEKYYPSPQRLRMGQLLWPAILACDKPHPQKSIRDCRQVPVVLTL